jgi:50S ribosomal protein L16 3-hydroxylase
MQALLGGMSSRAFLRDHWQKRPLLVRQAVPGFAGIVEVDRFVALANREDATSRLIIQHPRRKQRWERHDGPFAGLEASLLPASHWTLLVHGVESLIPGGWELLRRFDFIPAARIDDLMISYASDGGGVGPHDDLYDVFLLQGPGKRRWQISTQADRTIDDRAAIKVLADFRPDPGCDWLLEPGDMLYVPPGVAHRGVAEGPCFTYSIGFLAPSHEAIVHNFLGYLGQTLDPDPARLYQDPDLGLQRQPLAVADAMVAQIGKVLDSIRWDAATVGDFVGRFLTGPKPNVRFAAPARPVDAEAFARRLRGKGRLRLALGTRGLVRGNRIFINGESHAVSARAREVFTGLVRDRGLGLPLSPPRELLPVLHQAYRAGWLLPPR